MVRPALIFLTVGAVLSSPARAAASPITLLYTGSVVSSFDQGTVPTGSPATIIFTVDPAANLLPGWYFPNTPPSFAGVYAFTAIVSFLGRTYTANGNLGVNWDDANAIPNFGQIWTRNTGIAGPTGPSLCDFQNGQGCPYYQPVGSTSPLSPALPFLTGVRVQINHPFVFDPSGSHGLFAVAGFNPQPVPEPSTWVLLSAGFAIAAARRRFVKRTHRPDSQV
jgi:hypothetical protein